MSIMPSTLTQGNSSVDSNLELTVTGEDADNNLFREKVRILNLQGRDCTYETRRRVQPGSSLMVEISLARAGVPGWRAAAIVETVSPVTNQDLFHIGVVLGRDYESAPPTGATQSPKTPATNIIPERLAPVSAPVPAVAAPQAPRSTTVRETPLPTTQPKRMEVASAHPAPVSERQIQDLKVAVASQMEAALQGPLSASRTEVTTPAAPVAATQQPAKDAESSEAERISAIARPMLAQMVREAVTSESKRQGREMKSMLSHEVENVVREPLAVMARYTQTLPAIDEKTVQQMLRQVAELQLERTVQALKPLIEGALRSAIAAEYERQTLQLKNEIFAEVGKAVQGPAALQMAAMLDSAFTTRMAQYQIRDHQETPSLAPAGTDETVQQLMQRLQAKLESLGGNMRCVLESEPTSADASADVRAARPLQPPASGANNREL